ncbi:MAG: hypothetical protein CM15mP74_27900 [Halieaceae bacterium]|nr:MAG: hypothetical protein CM15mP74_27900 [Halieaceae bacterium]
MLKRGVQKLIHKGYRLNGKYASSSSAHHAGLDIFDFGFKLHPAYAEVIIYPAKLSVTDLKGGAFSSPTTVAKGKGDTEILDFTSLKASDGKFARHVYVCRASDLGYH